MLKARNLDDQTYEEIVQAAEGRLPWLCPAWTDHNAHDPGITVLELMAWYKELQQYQMNQFTDGLKWKLLKLAGISPRPAAPAACAVELEPDGPARQTFAWLITREGIPFELAEGVPDRRPALAPGGGGREGGMGYCQPKKNLFYVLLAPTRPGGSCREIPCFCRTGQAGVFIIPESSVFCNPPPGES